VHLDRLDHVVHQVSKEAVVRQELQAHRDQRDHRVRPAEQDLLEPLDSKVNKEEQGRQDQLDSLVPLDLLEILEPRDLPDLQEQPGLLDSLVRKVLPGQLEPLAV